MLSLSAATCAMSLNRLSIIVLMILVAPHSIDLEVPGPVIGFAYGIAVLVLGLAKAVVLG